MKYCEEGKEQYYELGRDINVLTKTGEVKMKFRKKPVVIEAFKFDGDLMGTDGEYYVPDWAVSAYRLGILYFDKEKPIGPPCELFIRTLEGNMMTNVGDWVIQGVNGELYPCKPDIFEKTYEPVQEDE